MKEINGLSEHEAWGKAYNYAVNGFYSDARETIKPFFEGLQSNSGTAVVIPKIAEYLQKLIDEYIQILKTDRYKEDASFNVDEYYADLQKVTEDLRKLKKYTNSNFSA